ncbi:MAG: hypothetical protein NUV51_11705 [Sulfuricaulis sp.]|nr:hypothetical protein [Sulfuricaulis sp.]
MPDLADNADSVVELWTADAERRARGKSAPESDPGFDGLNCVTCLEPIPTARLKMGKIRCVDCQERLDMANRMTRRR